MEKYNFRGDNMEKFVYTSSEELKSLLLANGCKFLYSREFNGELMYVFVNEPNFSLKDFKRMTNDKFNKEQLFVTDKLFF
jgi:hypothetical protein